MEMDFGADVGGQQYTESIGVTVGESGDNEMSQEPLIQLSGGAQFLVGPESVVRAQGGSVAVGKGSRMIISQGAKMITVK